MSICSLRFCNITSRSKELVENTLIGSVITPRDVLISLNDDEFAKFVVRNISGLSSLKRSALLPNSNELPCCSISYWSETVVAEDVDEEDDDDDIEFDGEIVGVISSAAK